MHKQVFALFGASGGIGSSLAKKMTQDGHTVYLLGRSEDKLKSLSSSLSQPYLIVDPFSEQSVENALHSIVEKEKKLDGVSSCIGSFCIKPLHLTTLEQFQEVMHVNMTSSFCITKVASHLMSANKSGSIVLCSSVAALTGLASHEAIAAAKGAVASFVRASAASLATKGIRVNAVAPGLTRTPLSAPITSNEAALKASTSFHPMGRIGEPEDVASAIYWLMSQDSSWVTGQVISIDGGLSTLRVKMS